VLGAGVLRLGFMADFISSPVLAGFKAGVGLLIAAGQLGKVLGVPQEGDSFFARIGSVLSQLGDISWPTFALAAVSIAILLAFRRWRRRRCPAPSSWSPSASWWPPPPGWRTGAWPWSAPSHPACPSSPPPTWTWSASCCRRRRASP
jgi:MFS superfamily sulfate permease-like transporter